VRAAVTEPPGASVAVATRGVPAFGPPLSSSDDVHFAGTPGAPGTAALVTTTDGAAPVAVTLREYVSWQASLSCLARKAAYRSSSFRDWTGQEAQRLYSVTTFWGRGGQVAGGAGC
jgi:hypothetical protein